MNLFLTITKYHGTENVVLNILLFIYLFLMFLH